MTIVYEILWILAIFAWSMSQRNPQSFLLAIIWNCSIRLARLTIVYCLFLMQYHNNAEYYRFLRIIHRIGIYIVIDVVVLNQWL